MKVNNNYNTSAHKNLYTYIILLHITYRVWLNRIMIIIFFKNKITGHEFENFILEIFTFSFQKWYLLLN